MYQVWQRNVRVRETELGALPNVPRGASVMYTIRHRPEHMGGYKHQWHAVSEAWFVLRDGKPVTVALPSLAKAESALAVLVADDQRMQRERRAALKAVS